MAILTKTVTMYWTGGAIEYYKSLGYNYTGQGTKFEVKVEHLPPLSNKKVDVKCDFCGKEYNTKRNYYQKTLDQNDGKYKCLECFNEERCYSTEEAQTNYWNYGFEPLFEKYTTSHDPLPCRCIAHPEDILYFSHRYIYEKAAHCPKCEAEKVAERRYKDGLIALEIFKENRFDPLFAPEDYKTKKGKLPCLCLDHPSKIYYTSVDNILLGRRCHDCGREKKMGENNKGWKGGISEISYTLRGYTTAWLSASYKANKNQCVITGEIGGLCIHHIVKPFIQIRDEVFEITKIPVKPTLGDYSQEELDKLRRVCIGLHFHYGLGVPIKKSLHNQFHALYKKVDNTPEQFWEFKERYLVGEFNDDSSADCTK